jgi:hypothetical protein
VKNQDIIVKVSIEDGEKSEKSERSVKEEI